MNLLLLFTLFANQMLFMSIVDITPELSYAKYIVLVVTILSIIFSPLQAGISDTYCRKKSLIFALIITLLSTTFYLIWVDYQNIFFLTLYIIFVGVAGNVTPIILSSFKDIIKSFTNFRFIISIWILTFYLGESFPDILRQKLPKGSLLGLSTFLSFVALFLLVVFFKDTRDKSKLPKILVKDQASYIYQNFFKNKLFLLSLLGYFFAIISLYQITFRSEILKNLLFENIPLEFIIGSLMGMIFFKFFKKDDTKSFYLGFISSLVAINLLFLLSYLDIKYNQINIGLVIIYSFGYCLFISSLYCILTKPRHHHDYGKIFGIIESIDSLGYFFAASLIFFLKDIQMPNIWLISSLFMLLSGVFFHIYIKKETTNLMLTP